MARALVCLGDKTTYGAVLSASSTCYEGNRALALTGDMASCSKCGGIHQIMGTVFDMSEDGKAFVATGDRVLCQCPNNVVFGSTTQYVSSATGIFSKAAPVVVEALTTAATLSPSALPVAPVPVFAKSCERGAGNTDAGTTDEPHSNFGRVGYYVPAPLDTMPPEPVQHAQAATRKPSNTGKHSENDLPWYKRMFGAKSDAPAQSGMPLAVPAATNAGVELAAAGWQGLRFVGGGFMTAGRWLVRTSPTGAAIIGMLPGTLNEGEPDMLAGSQLAALAGKSAPTRIRFQWLDAGDGQLKPVAYHTGADSGLDQVRVRSMRKNSHTGNYEFWADGADKPTIIWTPDELEFKAPANTGNRDAPYLPSTITVLPLPGADEVGSTSTSLPIPDEKSFDDYILVNLPHGMPPIYIYLSKPPVKLLDVDLYSNFTGRPRNGTHADHMPSAAAVRAKLRRMYPDAKAGEIDSLAKDVAAIVIPADVHQKLSATYGGRNNPERIEQDSRDLRAALERDFKTISPELKARGVTDMELDEAKTKMNQLNQEKGLYNK